MTPSTAEISIDVDARDEHLTVRVIDSREANNTVTSYNWAKPTGVIRSYLQTVTMKTQINSNPFSRALGGDHGRLGRAQELFGRLERQWVLFQSSSKVSDDGPPSRTLSDLAEQFLDDFNGQRVLGQAGPKIVDRGEPKISKSGAAFRPRFLLACPRRALESGPSFGRRWNESTIVSRHRSHLRGLVCAIPVRDVPFEAGTDHAAR